MITHFIQEIHICSKKDMFKTFPFLRISRSNRLLIYYQHKAEKKMKYIFKNFLNSANKYTEPVAYLLYNKTQKKFHMEASSQLPGIQNTAAATVGD